MSDNTALCIVFCVALLCLTTCSVSDDWKKVQVEQHQCPSVQGKKDE